MHKIGTAFSGSDNLSSICREKYAHHQSSQNLKIIEPSSSVEAEMLAPSQGHRTQQDIGLFNQCLSYQSLVCSFRACLICFVVEITCLLWSRRCPYIWIPRCHGYGFYHIQVSDTAAAAASKSLRNAILIFVIHKCCWGAIWFGKR